MYPIVRVDPNEAVSLEQLGSKRKFWYQDAKDGRLMLFKAEERGTGEDWAEKVACELCALLGLPHVHYELTLEVSGEARMPGVVCETCAPPPRSLVLGNQLMLDHDPAYPSAPANRYKVVEHTVEAVARVVGKLELPPPPWRDALPAGIESALDVFTGYVMLDAWIANQDRHHENWGALRDGSTDSLAPTFDHGASMARNVSDEERQARMTSRDGNRQIPAFARRARSAFFADGSTERPLGTVAAWEAFSRLAPGAGAVWVERLRLIPGADVANLLAEVPPHRLSPVGRDFTLRLLTENRRRILDGDVG